VHAPLGFGLHRCPLVELVGTIVTSASAMFKMERLDAHRETVNTFLCSPAAMDCLLAHSAVSREARQVSNACI
jgi:hypothetical protein